MFFVLHSVFFGFLPLINAKTQAYGWKGVLFYITLLCCLGGVSFLNLWVTYVTFMEALWSGDSYSFMEYWGLFIENYKEYL